MSKVMVLLLCLSAFAGCKVTGGESKLSDAQNDLFYHFPIHKNLQYAFDHWSWSEETKDYYRQRMLFNRRVADTYDDPQKFVDEQDARLGALLAKKKHYHNVTISMIAEGAPYQAEEIQLLDIQKLAVMVIERPIEPLDYIDSAVVNLSRVGGQRFKHRDLMLVAFTYGRKRYSKQIGWNTSQEIAARLLFTNGLIGFDETRKVPVGVSGSGFDRNNATFIAAVGWIPYYRFEIGNSIIADSEARMERITQAGGEPSFVPQLWRSDWNLRGETDKVSRDGLILDGQGNLTSGYTCISLQIAGLNEIIEKYFDNDPNKLNYRVIQGFSQ